MTPRRESESSSSTRSEEGPSVLERERFRIEGRIIQVIFRRVGGPYWPHFIGPPCDIYLVRLK
jgi:hypothetical protein